MKFLLEKGGEVEIILVLDTTDKLNKGNELLKYLKERDKVKVKVIGIDNDGRISLSRASTMKSGSSFFVDLLG